METFYYRCRFLSKRTAAALAGAVMIVCCPLLFPFNAHAQKARPTAETNAAAPTIPGTFSKRIVQGGLSLDLQIDHQNVRKSEGAVFREGEQVNISLRIQDAATSNSLSGLNPAAWLTMVRKGEQTNSKGCSERVRTLLGGGLLGRAELDLNVYHVLALNSDPTITVVDPLFGYGSTKLLTLIRLESPGDDWAITSQQEKLFVSMPAAGKVAVIDTSSWSVDANIDVGPGPARLALQPDEAYLWVSCGDSAQAGMAVVSLKGMKTVARFQTGKGQHEIAFSDDSRFAFVTNEEARTISVIDVRKLIKIKDISIGSKPTSIAFSKLAQAAYVSSNDGGTITVISSPKHEVAAQIKLEPGLGQIKFAPGDRLGFIVNTATNTVNILDVALNRIIQKAAAEKGPDQLAFSSKLAYIRQRDSEIVLMIPLNEVGKEGLPVPVVDFPGGQNPLGKTSRPSLADSIVRAAGDNAVLVANSADKTIYYYQEGMAAPMGNFSNYGREPRAVLIVDRSLRERKPGTYRTVARLPQTGPYKIVMFINSPRVVECVDFTIDPNPELAESNPPRIEPVTVQTTAEPGKQIQMSFRIIDSATGKPITGLKDVMALTFSVGVWQDRRIAEHVGEGIYSLNVTPPAPAVYNVYLSCASVGLAHKQVSTFEAKSEK
jgi:DNA-binding beta-propeller fold protein YncE